MTTAVPTSAADDPAPGHVDTGSTLRRRRWLYRVTTVALSTLMLLAVADIRLPIFGVDSTKVRAEGPRGTQLVVTYPEVARPALAAPFAVEVTDPSGFDGPIEVAINRRFVTAWDENGFYPSPESETGDPDWVVYEFEPPAGTTFRLSYDSRIEPARQTGVDGRVQLRSDGEVVAEVGFTMEVRP